MEVEGVARRTIDCGFRIHKELGSGLLESVYEAVLAASLIRAGLMVERQKPIAISFDGLMLAEGFRADLVVESRLIVEIKSVERNAPVHAKQLLTYLGLMEQPLGLLMNFWLRDISRRIETHGQRPVCLRADPEIAILICFVPSCLRVNRFFS